jgi:hypothetical protein
MIAPTQSGCLHGTAHDRLGCSACHVPSIETAPAGTVINGGTFVVPAALGNKIIHPFGDFLLHDIETGDGIVQTPPQDTANKTANGPPWGLRPRPRYMHDLRLLTLQNAIERREGEAEHARSEFRELPEAESSTDQFSRLAVMSNFHTLVAQRPRIGRAAIFPSLGRLSWLKSATFSRRSVTYPFGFICRRRLLWGWLLRRCVLLPGALSLRI